MRIVHLLSLTRLKLGPVWLHDREEQHQKDLTRMLNRHRNVIVVIIHILDCLSLTGLHIYH